jgi:hypothetical protein
MQKREIIWIAALVGIVAFYYHFFGGRNGPRPMVIHASLRPGKRDVAVFPVYFTLNDDFRLTSLKVVALENGQINPATMPVWNLVADGKSEPTRAFFYGEPIKGMKAALANVQPDPLTPGVIYRILLSSGKVNAALDFKTREAE